ncbi:MAG: D-glycero-alpha-D-manno-heptose-1,7-bisphosphate 7-phosphatase [Planctomycetota bacterium]|jgi:D-glycero-D-manno-heptose 1,7-bisphosphate phosphatase
MTRAVFLDRDNTIIQNDDDLGDPDQVKLIQGAASAIASLRGLGFQIVVVTNQGGVARGLYEEADVDRVHERIAELVKQTSGAIIERFYYCPYHPEATVERYKQEHPWRKPQPGMLLQAAEDLGLNLESCWMVGDQLRDIEAGWAAGVRSVLLQPDAKEPEGYHAPEGKRLLVAANLVDAVRLIAQHPQAERGDDLQQQNIIRSMKNASTQFGAGLPGAPGGGAHQGGASKLAPAIEKIHEGPNTSTVPKDVKAQRPFKPWDIQPVIVPATHPPTPLAPEPSPAPSPAPIPVSAIPPAPPEPIEQPAPTEVDEVAPLDGSDSVGTTEASSTEATAPEAGVPAIKPKRRKKKVRKKSQPRPPAETSLEDTPPPAPADGPTVANLLQQILRELKGHRAHYGDFSWLKMLAGLTQMLALGCVAFGLYYMQDPAVFNQWALGAVFCQLVVITMLITHHHR